MILVEGDIDITLHLQDTIVLEFDTNHQVRIYATASGKRWFAINGEDASPKFCFETKSATESLAKAQRALLAWERTSRKQQVLS